MFVKIFGGSLLLLGVLYIQFANSLECYSCNSAQSCKSPGKITCNEDYSNQTIRYLSNNFNLNATNITLSKNFNCIFQNYTSSVSGQQNITYKGCVTDRVKACSLVPRQSGLQKKSCNQCSSKLCNPAGTFSSSLFTVFASIIVVTVYKALNL